jgi:hypothetical protein
MEPTGILMKGSAYILTLPLPCYTVTVRNIYREIIIIPQGHCLKFDI